MGKMDKMAVGPVLNLLKGHLLPTYKKDIILLFNTSHSLLHIAGINRTENHRSKSALPESQHIFKPNKKTHANKFNFKMNLTINLLNHQDNL